MGADTTRRLDLFHFGGFVLEQDFGEALVRSRLWIHLGVVSARSGIVPIHSFHLLAGADVSQLGGGAAVAGQDEDTIAQVHSTQPGDRQSRFRQWGHGARMGSALSRRLL
jgi:hypothetical protein